MNPRVALGTLLTLATIAISLTSSSANPIPYPAIKMPQEYIHADIVVTDGHAAARVNGTYPFENLGYQNISMSYPLPLDATDVSVMIDGDNVVWWFTDQTYSTVFGDLPMINWTISPAPNTFTVEVDYRHSVPIVNQNFTYFYAMGTWKNTYAKQMTAHVTADIDMESLNETETLDICVYEVLFNSTTLEWIWKPIERTVTKSGNTFHVVATIHSDMFTPIKGDFILTFKPSEIVPEFHSSIVLSLFIIATLLAIIFARPRDGHVHIQRS